jgi:hypothetical protein
MMSALERHHSWQPWGALAGFGLLLHFVWEMLQTPFYTGMSGAPHWDAVLQCGRATLGDVVIVLLSYGGVRLAVHTRLWLLGRWGWRLLLFLAIGLVITIGLEWLSVYRWHRWAYAPEMPLLFGIGVIPLVQWLVLPPLNLWLARRHLSGVPAETN